jgi:hypothetical protein
MLPYEGKTKITFEGIDSDTGAAKTVTITACATVSVVVWYEVPVYVLRPLIYSNTRTAFELLT